MNVTAWRIERDTVFECMNETAWRIERDTVFEYYHSGGLDLVWLMSIHVSSLSLFLVKTHRGSSHTSISPFALGMGEELL